MHRSMGRHKTCNVPVKQLYHETDEACTLTLHASDIVLPFLTCTSCDPAIRARAAKGHNKIEIKLANGFWHERNFSSHIPTLANNK